MKSYVPRQVAMLYARIAVWAWCVTSACLVLGAAKVGGRQKASAQLALNCLVAALAMAAADRAMAVNECGAASKNSSSGFDTVVCTATSGTGNPYAAGIFYNENTTGLPVNNLTVELSGSAPGAVAVNALGTGVSVTGALNHNVTVNIDAGASVTATTNAVMLAGSGAAQGSVNNQGTVSSGTNGIFVSSSIPVSIFDSGTISGGSKAIDLSGNVGGNTVILAPGFAITGNVVGQGADTLQLGGTGTGTFNLSNIGANAQFQGFANFDVVSATWLATGTGSESWTIASGGTLQLGNSSNTGLITGNITANGTLAVGNPATVTLPGIISGNGKLTQIGTGTTILGGANSYSGGTSITGGTLSVTNAGALGTGGVTVSSGATLNVNNVTIGNTLVLNGNGYGGATGAGALTGTGTSAVNGNITLSGYGIGIGVANASDTLTLRGAIGDGGSGYGLLKSGSGTLILSGANTYTGLTYIEGGTLALGQGGSIAASSGVFLGFSNGVFDISGGGNQTISSLSGDVNGSVALGSNTLTVNEQGFSVQFGGSIADGGISGGTGGSLIKSGTGTMSLGGPLTYTGTTTVAQGTLLLASSIATSSAISIANGAVLDISHGPDQTLRNLSGASGSTLMVSGQSVTVVLSANEVFSGSIYYNQYYITYNPLNIMAKNFIFTLSGGNSYNGLTTISSGTLALGPGGNIVASAGVNLAAAGAIFDISQSGDQVIQALSGVSGSAVALGSAKLTVPGTASTTFAGVLEDGGIAGGAGGGLVKQGSGMLVLTGTNTYTGATTIGGGALQIGAGGSTGSIASPAIAIAQGAELQFDRSDNLTYGGVISGAGTMLQTGGGTLVLNGTSSGFTGSTTISTGTLEVGDASHSSATLGGNVSVASGAALMGHGTISGNVTSSGTVQPGGTIGIMTVGGNYTQNSGGTLVIEITPSAASGAGVGYSQFRVGGSASLAGGLSILDDAGTYAVGSRYVVLTAAGGRNGTFTTIAYNPIFVDYITPVVSYDANDVFLTLDPTPGRTPSAPPPIINGGQEVPDALTAMASAMEGVGDTVLGDVCGPTAQRLITQGEGCIVRALATGYQSEIWMRGLGGLGGLTGGGARMAFHDDYGGLLIGAGISRDGFTMGAGGGYLSTSLHFTDGSNAQQNAGLGFVYGRYLRGPGWLGVMAAYGGGRFGGERALPDTGLTASGNRAADFGTARARAAYDLVVDAVTLEPRVDLVYTHAWQSGFSESGVGPLDLAYPGTHADAVEGWLALRVMRRMATGNWIMVPWIEAGVQRAFSGLSRGVVATDGAFSIGVSGASPAPTAGVVGVGISAAATEALDLFMQYQGQFSANQVENAFSAGLQIRF
jgi:autotransporter-associated beta strand protein